MRGLRLDPNGAFRKCAKIVGEVMGNYHPHGDQAIYDALARLAQDFNVRYPLVDGQGNFGNIDGDNPGGPALHRGAADRGGGGAAGGARRGRGRLPRQLRRLRAEPVVLPAAFPNLLANGSSRHRRRHGDQHPAAQYRRAGQRLPASRSRLRAPRDEKLLDFVQGPDFPTGGVIVEPRANIKDAYRTGRGSFRLRARWAVEDLGRGTWQVVVTEIPYQVQKGKLIERLAELINLKKVPILADVRDESAEDVRIVLEPRARTVDPAVMMEMLFRASDLETRFAMNMNVLIDGRTPQVSTLKEVLRAFLDHRRDVLLRRARFRLGKIDARLEVLEGLLVAYLNLDRVIEIIRYEDEPKAVLMAEFSLSDVQAEAILNMRLRNLRRLEEMEIRAERDALTAEREGLAALLADEALQWSRICRGAARGAQGLRQGRPRRRAADDLRRCARRRGGLLRGDDRARADHHRLLGDGLDPRDEGPSRARRRAQVQGRRRAALLPPRRDHRPAAALRLERADVHARLRQPAGRARHGRAGAADDRPAERGADRWRSSCTSRGSSCWSPPTPATASSCAEDEGVAQTRAGKQILNLREGTRARVCRPVTGDHVAMIGENRKMLVFPIGRAARDGARQGRAAAALQGRRAVATRSPSRLPTASSGRTRPGGPAWSPTSSEWLSTRATAGRMAPRGFPRENRFD